MCKKNLGVARNFLKPFFSGAAFFKAVPNLRSRKEISTNRLVVKQLTRKVLFFVRLTSLLPCLEIRFIALFDNLRYADVVRNRDIVSKQKNPKNDEVFISSYFLKVKAKRTRC